MSMCVSSQAVVLLLSKYDSNCDTEIDGKEVFLQNAFTTLTSLLSQGYSLVACHGISLTVLMVVSPLPRLVC